MELAEREAALAGYRQLQLTASLTGVPLYESLGYEETTRTALSLPGGLRFKVVAMRKTIEPNGARNPRAA
jgi:hypothetical protein